MDIKKFFYKYILKRFYYRYGRCKRCGDCCSRIYVKHECGVLKDAAEFKQLQKLDDFYAGLEIIGKDSQGLVFRCRRFDREKRICTIHYRRSAICRKYPSEEIFKFKGVMSENCGYYFKPIESFAQVLEKMNKKF